MRWHGMASLRRPRAQLWPAYSLYVVRISYVQHVSAASTPAHCRQDAAIESIALLVFSSSFVLACPGA